MCDRTQMVNERYKVRDEKVNLLTINQGSERILSIYYAKNGEKSKNTGSEFFFPSIKLMTN